jgi:hypothetical protein
MGTDVSLCFESSRGGVVENIYVFSINMGNIPADPILFDLYYSGKLPVPEADEKWRTNQSKRLPSCPSPKRPHNSGVFP